MTNLSKIVLVLFSFFALLSGCEGTSNDIFIQDLIDKKKIKVYFNYANIEKIGIKVHNRRLRSYWIKIPIGTILSPADNNFQNMLCYTDVVEKVNPHPFSREIEIPTVCINLQKEIPDDGLEFSFHKQSKNKELNLFIKNLAELDTNCIDSITGFDSPNNSEMQAAVWIITDNADYNELGTLVSDGQDLIGTMFDFPPGERVLGPRSTAIAMLLLNKCGVDVKSKRIWNDRFHVYENLEESYRIKRLFENFIDSN